MEKTKAIVKNGYEYILVFCEDRTGIYQPNYMGLPGFALRSCKKVKKNGEAREAQPDQDGTKRIKPKKR